MKTGLFVGLAVAERPAQSGVPLLVDAHHALGHSVEVFNVMEVPPDAFPKLPYDAVHSRASNFAAYERLRFLENAGVPVVNSSAGFLAGRDKWVCYQKLGDRGVPAIPSTLATKPVSQLPGDDVLWVLKGRTGFSGRGVETCLRENVPARVRERLGVERDGVILQPYVEGCAFVDMRVVVVDGSVLYAVERRNPNDFRANISAGGVGVKCPVSGAVEDIAIRAAEACNLVFAGVDLTVEPSPRVVEVNTNLGFSVSSRDVTGVDVAREMARYFDRFR